MKTYETAEIRNFVLAGHGGAGKTSLAEAMLFSAGAISRLGKVTESTSTLDFTPEEHKRKTGVSLALAQFEFEGRKLNLLDAPGFADFVGEVLAGIRAADFGIVVTSAVAGVEPETEHVFEMLEEEESPRIFAVNGMDKEQADFDKVLGQIQSVISDRAIPLLYPIGAGPEFRGLVDVVGGKAFMFGDGGDLTEAPIPGDLEPMIDDVRGKLVELAAESDDAYLEKFLETLELDPDEVLRGLRMGIAQGKIYPVVPVSAEKNLGVLSLLRFIKDFGPSPADVAGVPVTKPGSDKVEPIPADPAGPLAVQVFKISSEFIAQEIALLRVFSGSLGSGSEVYNSSRESAERVGQLYCFKGKERSEIDKLPAGDIGAVAKLKTTGTNETLTVKGQRLVIEPIRFPETVHEVAVRPVRKGDEEKVGIALSKLKDEDPTFQLVVQGDLHQTVLRTMGEQHTDVLTDRVKRKFGVEVEVARPRLPYRETITGSADVSYRHKKQTGGRGQFADVSIKVEATERGFGYEFVNEIVGGVIPTKFIPAVEKGILEQKEDGILAGYPMVDFRVRLHFGGYHEVDSSEMAFKLAASQALKKGMQEARPVLLEPILLVEILVPEDYTGGVMGDLSSRRGRIQGMEPGARAQTIKATVPQGEMYRYSTTLRTLTQGRARFRAEFSHYEEVPREVADKLIEELRKQREAE